MTHRAPLTIILSITNFLRKTVLLPTLSYRTGKRPQKLASPKHGCVNTHQRTPFICDRPPYYKLGLKRDIIESPSINILLRGQRMLVFAGCMRCARESCYLLWHFHTSAGCMLRCWSSEPSVCARSVLLEATQFYTAPLRIHRLLLKWQNRLFGFSV